MAVWCFFFLCLLGVSAAAEDFARNQGGALSGILSKKTYLAMFAYFNACLLGVQLRYHLTLSGASLRPHYRRKHLLVVSFLILVFLAIPMFLMEWIGTRDVATSSIAVIFCACLSAGLWTLHHPVLGLLAVPFLAFTMLPPASSPALAAFLAGEYPAASAGVIVVSLVSLCVLAWRLSLLNEEMFEYAFARAWGDLFRGRSSLTFQDLAAASTTADGPGTLPTDQGPLLKNYHSVSNPFSSSASLDSLSGYCERSLWQRLQLWRLGTAPTGTSISVFWQILISLTAIPVLALMPLPAGVGNPARDAVFIMSVMIMTNPFNVWLYWFIRLRRLGYESLRPRTRPQFVQELGLALLWDIIQCWLGGLLFMVIAAAIWAPELLHIRSVIVFVLGTATGLLCVFALLGIGLLNLKKRGLASNLLCAFGPFVMLTVWTLFMMHVRISESIKLLLASILVAASATAIRQAYRRWCRADLD